ncbi:MAG: DUF4338 domain-containing protein [Deltaproteobacteria bacterium]|nr:DUF4338 domain-containing protein [Deltaproteobacteria bacterium]
MKNLASHVLGQVQQRICEDWHLRWGYRPVLMETFVDPKRYRGRCYKALNWKCLGMTTGKNLFHKGKRYSTALKMVFVRPLVKDFRSFLCSNELKERVEA